MEKKQKRDTILQDLIYEKDRDVHSDFPLIQQNLLIYL